MRLVVDVEIGIEAGQPQGAAHGVRQRHHPADTAEFVRRIRAEKAAGRKPPKLTTDAERVAFLFERYQALTSLLPAAKPRKARKRKEAQ